MLYSPEKVCRFVVAAAILHNIRRNLKLQEDEDFVFPDHFDEETITTPSPSLPDAQITRLGKEKRDEICARFFA